MHNQEQVLRTFLKRQARKAESKGKTEDVVAIRTALDDQDGLYMAVLTLHIAEQRREPDDLVLSPVDEVIKFLQWLLDHSDELIDFIKKIIELFST